MNKEPLTKEKFIARVNSGSYVSDSNAKKALVRAKSISAEDKIQCYKAIESYFLAPPSEKGAKPNLKGLSKILPQKSSPPPDPPQNDTSEAQNFPPNENMSGDYSAAIKATIAAKCLDDILLVQIQLAERIIQGAHLAKTLNAACILSAEEQIKQEVDRTVLAIQEAVSIYKKVSSSIPNIRSVPSVLIGPEKKPKPPGVPLSKVYKEILGDEVEEDDDLEEEEEEHEEDFEEYTEDDFADDSYSV